MEGGNERQLNRTQPRDIASERALVGAVLIDADMTDRLLATVSPSDFYSRQLSSIYEAVCELHSEGIQADEVTLLGRLREKGVPEETAKEALRLASHKLPIATKFVVRRDYVE